MSNVAIEKVRDADALPPSFFEQVVVTADKVRQRAFELFQKRGDAGDRSLDDWLQAEREVILSPQSELIEKDGKFRVRVAVPGFDAKDIHVTAIPGALIVEAKAQHKHEKSEGDVYLCEFGQRQIFRRLDLPAPILERRRRGPSRARSPQDRPGGVAHIYLDYTGRTMVDHSADRG